VTLWAVPALASAAYQLLAIIAGLRWRVGQASSVPSSHAPPISLLKPVYGRNDHLYQALRSHALQDYPEFEILFGAPSPSDPALNTIDRLQREFPAVPMRVIMVKTEAPNPKVGVLARLAAEAKYPLLVINDDDIEAPPGYFRMVAAPFGDPRIGLVTCLYRAQANSFPARLEALGVATDFAPSVMVARFLGVAGFALGATMVLRAETLRQIGGFEPISRYLADDYELGRRVAAADGRIEFAPVIVDTGLGGASWRDVWRHQLRWARTIRVSRTPGYYGSLITHTIFWTLVAWAAHQWWAGGGALALRFAAAWIAGVAILEDAHAKRWFWLLPLRDLFGLAVWACGCFGSTVWWRGLKLRLDREGRIRK
jgi:ceramide glucosyltransferase